jgi:DNA-binding transcriptional ArsR family regulator
VRGKTRLQLGRLDAVAVSVVPHAGATLMSLLADVLGGRPQGAPQHWRRTLRAAAPAATSRVVGPLFTPAYSQVPDCVTMTGSLPGNGIDAMFDELAELPADRLTGELEADFGGTVPAQWQPVVDDPRRFIADYVAVMRGLWQAFAPVWERARPLLDRETERVGVATVTGRLDAVLSGLSPRTGLDGTTMLLPDPNPMVADLERRPVALVPLVSGSRASVFSIDREDLVWIGYPLPGLGHLWEERPPPGAHSDRLALVLGSVRAEILRRAGQVGQMSDVAAGLRCSASTATYHCAQLAKAGLITRERQGRQVRLRRTARGDALVDLMS